MFLLCWATLLNSTCTDTVYVFSRSADSFPTPFLLHSFRQWEECRVKPQSPNQSGPSLVSGLTSTVQPIQVIKVNLFLAILYPLPGLCIKTTSEPSKEKVFVNICQSSSIPPPPEISRDELVELLQSEEPSDYRVPMSLGIPHTEMDNSKWPESLFFLLMYILRWGHILPARLGARTVLQWIDQGKCAWWSSALATPED